MRLGSRIASAILAWALSPDDRQVVLGDLVEEYAIRREERSALSARWWYWSQVLRSVPWLLWSPVPRIGWAGTVGVASAACAAQAAIELTTAIVFPRVFHSDARGAVPGTFAVVLGSMVIVSWIANRVRPGAGALLTLIASVDIVARALHVDIENVHLSQVLEGASAPMAALLGTALAVNIRPAARST
jgi:hypothetical protein